MSSLAYQPAFPGIRGESGCGDEVAVQRTDGSFAYVGHNQGMTLRQHFAGLAMQGICAAPPEGPTTSSAKIAAWAVEQADALIAELEKPKP